MLNWLHYLLLYNWNNLFTCTFVVCSHQCQRSRLDCGLPPTVSLDGGNRRDGNRPQLSPRHRVLYLLPESLFNVVHGALRKWDRGQCYEGVVCINISASLLSGSSISLYHVLLSVHIFTSNEDFIFIFLKDTIGKRSWSLGGQINIFILVVDFLCFTKYFILIIGCV